MATRTVAPAKKAPRAPSKRAKRAPKTATNQAQVVPGTTQTTETDAGLVPGTTPHLGLSTRVAAFVSEYVKDFNGRQAAIRAGYSPRTADQQASRLLRSAKVKQALAPQQAAKVAERAEAINRMELSVERTRLEIARLAYFDPRKAWKKDGSPIPLHELDDDTAAAIAGFEVMEQFEGSGEERRLVGHLKKYKVADKNAALEKASKILGLYEKDNEQKGNPLAALLEGMGRSTLQIAQTVPDDDE